LTADLAQLQMLLCARIGLGDGSASGGRRGTESLIVFTTLIEARQR